MFHKTNKTEWIFDLVKTSKDYMKEKSATLRKNADKTIEEKDLGDIGNGWMFDWSIEYYDKWGGQFGPVDEDEKHYIAYININEGSSTNNPYPEQFGIGSDEFKTEEEARTWLNNNLDKLKNKWLAKPSPKSKKTKKRN